MSFQLVGRFLDEIFVAGVEVDVGWDVDPLQGHGVIPGTEGHPPHTLATLVVEKEGSCLHPGPISVPRRVANYETSLHVLQLKSLSR